VPVRAAAAAVTAWLDNVVVPGHPSAGRGPDGGQPGTVPVEVLGDLDCPGAWALLVDGVIQSHVDLGDPWHLELEYMRWLGHLADLAAPAGTPLRVLHLGGGGLTLARYVAATRPGSRQLAVEASARVARLVRRRLPLGQPGGPRGRAGQIRVRIADARAALGPLPAGSFDLVVADVFAGGRTPAHLTSVEFTAEAARALAPHGIYAVNVGDGPPLTHARARVATTSAVFPHTCLIAEPAVLRGRRFGNLVIAAGNHRLPVTGLAGRTATGQFPARVVHGPALRRFAAGSAPITDTSATPSPPLPPEVPA
jgi:spermidine synthase